ncbi:Malectin-like domain - like 10 [Theobroma cacao]|nr:Malectin-like domain - like 10 [Theobroma cacao]
MFPVLNNLLLVFVFAIASFDASSLMLTGGIQNEDVGRRKLVTENPGFISIDCGANGDYHDEATGIVYRTDRDFIDTGENHEVFH